MIFNIGAGVPYSVPVLNASYPADASLTVIESAKGSATFQVLIAEDGYPESYTYQWYWNGTEVSGANGSSYTRNDLTAGTYTVYCKVTNKAGTVTSRTASVTVEQYTKPVLNSSYPANVTQLEKSGGSATFEVRIATAGKPANYTYQWYVNGSPVSGATSSSYTRTGLTSAATYNVYCNVTNDAGSVNSRTATLNVQTTKPAFSYSGAYSLVQDSTYQWRLKFLTSGVVNFSHLGCFASGVDLFAVGGGGGGGMGAGGGGGGGYTTTSKAKSIAANTNYSVSVGAGGSGATTNTESGGQGGTSSFGSLISAPGGYGGTSYNGSPKRTGGSGGSGGGGGGSGDSTAGNGGSNGVSGSDGAFPGGSGQTTTTREFGESSGTLYSGGGAGAASVAQGGRNGSPGDGGGGAANGNGAANTGGGGGASAHDHTTLNGGAGGSGIVVIRDKR